MEPTNNGTNFEEPAPNFENDLYLDFFTLCSTIIFDERGDFNKHQIELVFRDPAELRMKRSPFMFDINTGNITKYGIVQNKIHPDSIESLKKFYKKHGYLSEKMFKPGFYSRHLDNWARFSSMNLLPEFKSSLIHSISNPKKFRWNPHNPITATTYLKGGSKKSKKRTSQDKPKSNLKRSSKTGSKSKPKTSSKSKQKKGSKTGSKTGSKRVKK
jgi:hypothetical protein